MGDVKGRRVAHHWHGDGQPPRPVLPRTRLAGHWNRHKSADAQTNAETDHRAETAVLHAHIHNTDTTTLHNTAHERCMAAARDADYGAVPALHSPATHPRRRTPPQGTLQHTVYRHTDAAGTETPCRSLNTRLPHAVRARARERQRGRDRHAGAELTKGRRRRGGGQQSKDSLPQRQKKEPRAAQSAPKPLKTRPRNSAVAE